MLSPKKVKFRKQQKGKMRGVARRGCTLSFGEFGLQATECGKLSAKQIEAARIAMTRHIKRGGRIWIRIFPDKPFTKKPAEVRMGKGKGSPEGWEAVIRPAEYFMKCRAFPKKWPKKPCGWQPINFQSKPNLSRGAIAYESQ